MSLLNLDKLNVAVTYVNDLEQSLKFYTNILGFEKAKDMSPGILLFHKWTGLTMYLEGDREQRESPKDKFPTMTLCFNSADGVKKAYDDLKAAEVNIVSNYGDFEGEFAGFQFEDPSGNLLEIAGRP